MLTYAVVCVQHRLLHLNAPEYVTAMAKAMDVGMPRYSLYLLLFLNFFFTYVDDCYDAAWVHLCDRDALVLFAREQLQRAAYVSIRPHTSAYVSIRQHTSAYVSIRQHTSAYVRIRQHTSEYVSIRQHTSAYVSIRQHSR